MAQSGDLSKQQNQLEKKRNKLEEEIAFTKKRIEDIKSKRSHSLSELNTLKRQLKAREELIATIRSQIKEADRQIAESQRIISGMEANISKLKDQYRKMVRNMYVHHAPGSNLLFVFSSKSFNDALRRVDYVKAHANFRRQQYERIMRSKAGMLEQLARLEQARNTKAEHLSDELRNRSELNHDKSELDRQITEFRKQESKYSAEIKEKEKAKAKLNSQIQALIAQAMKQSSKPKDPKKPAGSASMTLTKEASELSGQFAANKGKLPWPVEKGFISGRFGTRHIAELNIDVENNGIDITTERGAAVRAIFNGEVTNTFYSPVFKYGVLISHGNYFTVYTGLKQVTVKENDKVTTKQTIGIAHTKEETNVTEVHLEIWQGTTKLNPSLWVYQ